MQRIGRGNRRTGILKAVALVENEEEKKIMEEMFELASMGILPTTSYVPDLSVGVQQIFSLLYQHPQGLTEEELIHLLLPLCSPEQTRSILRNLHSKEWVEIRSGFYCATSKLMDFGEKGLIHSNIPEEGIYTVVDITSGKEVGKIAGVFDVTFLLAGRIWRVVSVEDDVIFVKRVKRGAFTPSFYRHSIVGAFFHLLPPPLKAQLLESLKAKV